jgi:hypothetical protein
MKPGYWEYIREAFHARPLGMFVPPNWIGLGVLGLLGVLNPGFWVLGMGLELAYLGVLASNARFQRLVGALYQNKSVQDWQTRINDLVSQLGPDGQRRYRSLEARCRSILDHQLRVGSMTSGLETQGEGLGRLLWVYLRLLLTRQAIERIVRETGDSREESERIEERIRGLEAQMKEPGLSEDLRRSFTGQVDILRQRLEKRKEAREKCAFLDAELIRIQEQTELIREQAVLATSPEALSERIDQIATTLGGTNQWIREQQQIYGAVEDLLAEPPPLSVGTPTKQSQSQ